MSFNQNAKNRSIGEIDGEERWVEGGNRLGGGGGEENRQVRT
jgi:hypothetical protein